MDLKKFMIAHLMNKFTAFYGTQSFSTEKSLSLDRILGEMNPIHNHTPYFLNIYFKIIFPSPSRSDKQSVPFKSSVSYFICYMSRLIHPS